MMALAGCNGQLLGNLPDLDLVDMSGLGLLRCRIEEGVGQKEKGSEVGEEGGITAQRLAPEL